MALDAFVTDHDGHPVPNLQLEDFELLEDGKPQAISTFSAVNIPIHPPPPFSPAAPPPDVATNGGRDGRLYVIAIDEIDAAMALRTRHHLRTFIERHFESNDVGVVVNVGRASASGGQDLTSDRALLLAAIDRLSGWPPPLGTEPPSLPQRRRAAALKALVASLAAIPERRKALIYITHDLGDVFDVVDYKGGARSLEFDDLRAAMTDAMRGGVAIYTMDPCGLAPAGGMVGEEPGDVPFPQPRACDVKIDRMMNFRM